MSNCQNCGKPFTKMNNRQKYCSSQCRSSVSDKRRALRSLGSSVRKMKVTGIILKKRMVALSGEAFQFDYPPKQG